jgi:DNA invertase Pin-like site-specific DNA recombinase
MAAKQQVLKVTAAYSYVRFSTPEQRHGDSLRRQTEAAAAWCERNHVKLDTSTTLHDLGRSAFKGKHRDDKAALGGFLKLVEAGKVPRGSFLVIENLDRLSREEVVPATHLLTGILVAGVRVVQLSPTELVLTDKSDPFDVMRAVMELSRGHGESAIKSERVTKAWAARRTHARNGEKLLTGKLPAWVTVEETRKDSFTLALDPERAKVIRKVFDLAAAGYGAGRIVRKLQADKVPAFGPSGKWNRVYVRSIIVDRRALGECQPLSGGEKDGPPIPDYFPAVVGKKEFALAGAAVKARKLPEGRRGRLGKHADLFAGMVKDARTGGAYTVTTSVMKGVRYRYLKTYEATEGRGPSHTFPVETFEAALLKSLCEVDHAELLGEKAPDRRPVLEAELETVRASKAQVVKAIAAGVITNEDARDQMAELKEREAELAEELAESGEQAARPLSDVWRETQTLAEAMDGTLFGVLSSPKDAAVREDRRLRLRAMLRRIIDSVYLLVTGRGGERLAAVQIWFKGNVRTSYRMVYISHRPPRSNGIRTVPGRWWAWTGEVEGTEADHPLPFLDLKKEAHAERVLGNLDSFRAVDLDGSLLDPKHLPDGWSTGVIEAKSKD